MIEGGKDDGRIDDSITKGKTHDVWAEEQKG